MFLRQGADLTQSSVLSKVVADGLHSEPFRLSARDSCASMLTVCLFTERAVNLVTLTQEAGTLLANIRCIAGGQMLVAQRSRGSRPECRMNAKREGDFERINRLACATLLLKPHHTMPNGVSVHTEQLCGARIVLSG